MKHPLAMIAMATTTLILIAGCAGNSSPSATRASVAEVQVALTAAEKAALRYAELPACPKAPACSDGATISKIKAADSVAYDAVRAARASGGNAAKVAAANATVAALVALVPASN